MQRIHGVWTRTMCAAPSPRAWTAAAVVAVVWAVAAPAYATTTSGVLTPPYDSGMHDCERAHPLSLARSPAACSVDPDAGHISMDFSHVKYWVLSWERVEARAGLRATHDPGPALTLSYTAQVHVDVVGQAATATVPGASSGEIEYGVSLAARDLRGHGVQTPVEWRPAAVGEEAMEVTVVWDAPPDGPKDVDVVLHARSTVDGWFYCPAWFLCVGHGAGATTLHATASVSSIEWTAELPEPAHDSAPV